MASSATSRSTTRSGPACSRPFAIRASSRECSSTSARWLGRRTRPRTGAAVRGGEGEPGRPLPRPLTRDSLFNSTRQSRRLGSGGPARRRSSAGSAEAHALDERRADQVAGRGRAEQDDRRDRARADGGGDVTAPSPANRGVHAAGRTACHRRCMSSPSWCSSITIAGGAIRAEQIGSSARPASRSRMTGRTETTPRRLSSSPCGGSSLRRAMESESYYTSDGDIAYIRVRSPHGPVRSEEQPWGLRTTTSRQAISSGSKCGRPRGPPRGARRGAPASGRTRTSIERQPA